MAKVLIGLTTFGPIPRAERVVDSILATQPDRSLYEIAIADDSRGGGYDVVDRRVFCAQKVVSLLENDTISGIPASWNRLVNFGRERGAEIVMIVSDGVRFLVGGWLERLVFFLEHNEKIGTVGLPHVNYPIFDANEERWDGRPGRVGCAVGCSFAFTVATHGLVKNIDGTTGFWEDLQAFHEEVDFGFSLAEQGYISAMLPWCPSYYRGGMAFAAHGDKLVWRRPSSYLPTEEFIKYAKMSPWHVAQYEEFYAKDLVDKMSYSRVMAAKKWGVLDEVEAGRRIQTIDGASVDILAEPQRYRHMNVVDPLPRRTVRWLDRAGQLQECDGF